MPEEVAILGAGTWGLALAKVLWENGHRLRLWDFYPQVIEKLKTERTHPRLKGLLIPEGVTLTADMNEAAKGASIVVLVVPSVALRSTCTTLRDAGVAAGVEGWVVCSKGIEPESLMLMHEVVLDVFGAGASKKIAMLTGPSHAEEVAKGLPTTVVAASTDPELATRIQRLFLQPRFRIYTHEDILGAAIGGAVKNVIAIAAGISDGMGFGDNTRAALITRSLVEIVRLGTAMGAQQNTFLGLAGLGDLIVTATSHHSRNHQFGELLASGKTCEEALKEVGMVVEGYNTALSAHALGRKHGVQMPLSEAVYQVLYENVPPARALENLLAREARQETLS